jgi:hypothetical protein
VRLSQQKHHDGAHGRAVGLGWHFARDGVTLWHNGETAGYHSYLAVVPSSRRAVCVLANAAGGAIDGLGERIVQQLHGQAAEPQKFELPVAVDRAELARLAGRYRMPPGLTLTIELRERGLFAQLTGQPALRLHPRSPTEFFYRAVEASITFDRDGDAVRALVLHQNGRDIRCERAEAAGR